MSKIIELPEIPSQSDCGRCHWSDLAACGQGAGGTHLMGASQITIGIEEAGLKTTDNGEGIDHEDVPSGPRRHATQ